MIFRQILPSATGCASYVSGCTDKKALAVVDSRHDHLDDYLAVAAEARSPIVAILETRVQANHLSGALVLAGRTGAPIHFEVAAVAFPPRSPHDGEEITPGNDYLRVLHTPGHSPDHICLFAGDRVRVEDPWSCSRAIPSLLVAPDASI